MELLRRIAFRVGIESPHSDNSEVDSTDNQGVWGRAGPILN